MKTFSLEELVYIRDALDKCSNDLEEGANFDYDKLHVHNLYKNLSSEFQTAIKEHLAKQC